MARTLFISSSHFCWKACYSNAKGGQPPNKWLEILSMNTTANYPIFTHDNSVLLMIDYQSGIANISKSQVLDDVILNAQRLLCLAKIFDIPVIFTSSEETLARKGLIFPELQAIVPGAYEQRVKRTGEIDAMHNAIFSSQVAQIGRKNLVIGGISTEECVSLPALTALNAGYNVKVIADACASHSEFTDEIQFTRMAGYGIDVTTVRQFVADMLVDWSTPAAKEYNELFTHVSQK